MDSVLQSINRIARRHPHLALNLYANFEKAAQLARLHRLQLEALYRRYFLLERLGLAAAIRDQLEAGLYLAEQNVLPVDAGHMMEALGRIHYTTGEYREAIKYWTRCIDLCSLSGDPYALVEARIGLGQIYDAMGDWQTGARFHRDAGEILKNLDAPYLAAKQAINLGVNLIAMGEDDSARRQFEYALRQATRAHAREYIAESYWHLGKLDARRACWDEAEKLTRKALQLAQECGYSWLRGAAVETLAAILLPQGRQAEVVRAYEEALQIALQTGSRSQQARCYSALSVLAEQAADLQQALHYARLHMSVQNELTQLSTTDRFRELRQYDLSQQPPIEKLLKLSTEFTIDANQPDLSLYHIAQMALGIVNVEWAVIWLLNPTTRQYECRALAGATSIDLQAGAVLDTARMPNYALQLHTIHAPVIAHDLRLHPAAQELLQEFAMDEVQSLLELPVRLHGGQVGVISFAQLAKRRNWSREDVLYGSHLSNLVERVLAEEEHQGIQRRLRRHNEGLEKRVAQRTSELKNANQALQDSLQQIELAHQHISQLSEIGREITATLDQDAVMACVSRHVHQLMPVDFFCVGFYQESLQRFDFQYTDDGRQLALLSPADDEDLQELADWCRQQQQELLISATHTQDDVDYPLAILEKIYALSARAAAIMIPFTLKSQVTGVLFVRTDQRAAYQLMHVNMLMTLTAYITVALDNSEAYRQLQFAQQHLQAQEKMAALGSLVAGISHELNTPIGNSLLCATTLDDVARKFRRQVQDGQIRRSDLLGFCENVDEACALLTRSLGSAADLVSSFKQVAVDQSSAQRRVFDLREVTQDVVRTLRQLITKQGHSIEMEIPPDIGMDSFPGAYSQVLINLINNAMLHGFDHGRPGRMHLHVSIDARDILHLSFRDDGVGIPQSSLQKIFDPFFTTKLGQGGSGLGLSIVYNIVTSLLGGSIHVKSEIAGGTEFILSLPRIAPQKTAA